MVWGESKASKHGTWDGLDIWQDRGRACHVCSHHACCCGEIARPCCGLWHDYVVGFPGLSSSGYHADGFDLIVYCCCKVGPCCGV